MSFLEGIDLSEAAKLSLISDLELRRNDARVADRFSDYHYVGGADLCLQHGEFWKGAVRPEKYERLRGEPNRCYHNSAKAVMTEPALIYVEGYCTVGTGYPFSHGWCVDRETNTVVELTLPCGPDEIMRGHISSYSRLPFMLPTKWGYYGVRFSTPLVTAHNEIGLPMLDRSMAEYADTGGAKEYGDCDHGFPMLRVEYDPDREELP